MFAKKSYPKWVFVSGIAQQGLNALVTNPFLGLKFLLLLLIATLLSYVHLSLQPQIDALFAQARSPVPADIAPRIGALRLRRKRIASICMFVVLTVSMLGVQVWSAFPLGLTVLLVIAIALFTWRAYKASRHMDGFKRRLQRGGDGNEFVFGAACRSKAGGGRPPAATLRKGMD